MVSGCCYGEWVCGGFVAAFFREGVTETPWLETSVVPSAGILSVQGDTEVYPCLLSSGS